MDENVGYRLRRLRRRRRELALLKERAFFTVCPYREHREMVVADKQIRRARPGISREDRYSISIFSVANVLIGYHALPISSIAEVASGNPMSAGKAQKTKYEGPAIEIGAHWNSLDQNGNTNRQKWLTHHGTTRSASGGREEKCGPEIAASPSAN